MPLHISILILNQFVLKVNKTGCFKYNVIIRLYFILKSFNKNFLDEVEKEYRAQIEKIIKNVKVDHIDSHVHMHAIPNLFKIVCKLAKEYNIPYVRTQFEKPYLIPDLKMFSKANIINLINL